ncbi:MAG: VOC family protein [Burkholderiales bacterium]|nr:VOC family protein [Burkholderiales bacterium]
MLERVDRMLLAVRDCARARDTFVRLLGAQPLRDAASAHLGARGAVLALGESELELWEPAGPGPVAEHLARWGEGLVFAGYASGRLDALSERLQEHGVPHARADGRLYLPAGATYGFPMAISPLAPATRAAGPVSFLYEATNCLASDWRAVAARYAAIFGLDAARFAPIASERWGYEGTLALFDPAVRLDRIELSQTFAGNSGAMRRFVERRGGDALYMCFAESHDFDALRERLRGAGATLTARGGDVAAERDTLHVHPRDLHGMLLGISRTGFAWTWSGQPQRVPPRPGAA